MRWFTAAIAAVTPMAVRSATRLLIFLFLFAAAAKTQAGALEVFLRLLETARDQLANNPSTDLDTTTRPPDFSAADRRFQAFLDDNELFDGISYVLVDASGVIHLKTFGDHSEELVTMIASTSKVPAVMTLLALEEDTGSSFSMDQPIGEVFTVPGVYGDRTSAQLMSNTSGIPGLSSLALYGMHLCQFSFDPDVSFEECGQTLLTTELIGTVQPGEAFSYGGSQWQLAGVTASIAANKTWNQLVDEYLSSPCDLEVFTFGNMWEDLNQWTGAPDSLLGRHNPSIEGGAITTLSDYAKLLTVHVSGGFCGTKRVLSEESLAKMREDRGGLVQKNSTPYGLGWFIAEGDTGVFYDPGAFGSVSFIDTTRGIGGFIAIDDYSRTDAGAPIDLTLNEIIPLVQAAFDDANGVQQSSALSAQSLLDSSY